MLAAERIEQLRTQRNNSARIVVAIWEDARDFGLYNDCDESRKIEIIERMLELTWHILKEKPAKRRGKSCS